MSRTTDTHPPDARAADRETIGRLLAGWRGEIQARQAYELLAARERDATRAAVLRRMADAERGHRERLEARLRELGAALPDPATVRLPLDAAPNPLRADGKRFWRGVRRWRTRRSPTRTAGRPEMR